MNGYKETTGRSLASKCKHQFVYALISVGGRRLAYAFLYPLVLVYTLMPSVNRKSRAYVARRFKPQNRRQFFKHTYLLNLTFARTLVDRAVLGILGRVEVSSTEEERSLCRNLAAEGKGLVLLSAHVGCWQMAVHFMDFLDIPKYLVYYRNPQDHDKTVSEHEGRPAPYQFINPAGSLGGVVEMMSALEKGSAVCGMADRVFGDEKNAVAVNFFGGRIRVPYSFYRMAGAMGSPVVMMFFPRIGAGKFASLTVGPLRVPDLGAKKENYAVFAQQFVDALEAFCIQYPYQFFNYYDLWETSPCNKP